MAEGLRRRILRIIEAFETMPMSAARWGVFLAAIIVVRHFLEEISSRQTVFDIVAYLIHYPLGYIVPLIALVLVLSLLARERVARVSKLMLVAWLLTLLPPLLDIFLREPGKGPEVIGYLLVEPSQLGTAFLNLLNPFYGNLPGATRGIRLEALVGCLAGAAYVGLKTRSLGRALLTLPVVYVTMFFFFTLPVEAVRLTALFAPGIRSVVDLFFQSTGIARGLEATAPVVRANLSLSLIDVFVLVPLVAGWYRLHDPRGFRALFRGPGAAWLAYAPLLTFAGIVLGARLLGGAPGVLRIVHPFDAYALAGLLLSSFLAGVAAMVLGALSAGQPTGGAPAVAGAGAVHLDAPSDADLRAVLAVTAGLAALASYVVSFAALSYVLGFLAVCCLYYLAPLRFARIGGLSSVTLGLASLFAFSLGFSAYAGATTPLVLPRSVAVAIAGSVSLALLARDGWRVAKGGPRAPETRGLSRLLGAGPARAVAPATCALAAILPGVLLRSLPLTAAGVVAGVFAVVSIARGDTRTIPWRLLAILAGFLIAAHVLGAANLPVVRADAGRARAAALGGPSAEDTRPADPRLAGLEQRASELFGSGDYAEAARLFEEIVAEDPAWPGVYANLGVTRLRLGQADEAVSALEEAVARDPEDATAHRYLGQALAARGDLEAAGASLAKALSLAPADPAVATAIVSLGDLLVARGEYEQALAAYKSALSSPKPVEGLHSRLAQTHYNLRDFPSAEREIRTQIDETPRDPMPRVNLSNILVAQGRSAEARAELEAALGLTTDPAFRSRIQEQLRTISP